MSGYFYCGKAFQLDLDICFCFPCCCTQTNSWASHPAEEFTGSSVKPQEQLDLHTSRGIADSGPRECNFRKSNPEELNDSLIGPEGHSGFWVGRGLLNPELRPTDSNCYKPCPLTQGLQRQINCRVLLPEELTSSSVELWEQSGSWVDSDQLTQVQ